MPGPFDHPLLPVVGQWLAKIQAAIAKKGERFQRDADEGMKFFVGPYQWLYGAESRRTDRHFRQNFDDEDEGEIPAPKFQMTVNKVAEMVQIFGPVLYHKNPIRQVNPRQALLPDADTLAAFGGSPQAQMYLTQINQQGVQAAAVDKVRAALYQHYLNFTPTSLDLKTESRNWIEETIIRGMSCLWTEVYQPPGAGQKMVGSFYDSVQNLLIDPDMPSLRKAKWISRQTTEPVWEAERKWGYPEGYLKGHIESAGRQAEVAGHPDGSYLRATGQTNDLIVYHEIYSKTGLGGRLAGVADWVKQPLEVFGDYAYIVVASGLPHPLNVPPQLWDMEQAAATQAIAERVKWPIPFWADDAWPFVPLGFHWVPGDPWPMSHLAPGLGELKFLNWIYSFMAGKIRISSRDFIAVLEEASPDIKAAMEHGADYEILRIKGSMGKSIGDVVQFLQHPQFNADMWRIAEVVGELFDKRVGLSELIYGMSSRQDRSATESQTKRDQMTVRPDEMANKVEDAMTLVARQEALAIRFSLTAQDVAPVMGPVGTDLWARFVDQSDPGEILHQLEFRIEAGSAKKPNRDRDAANVQAVAQLLMPFFQQLAMSGLPGPFNTLLEMYAKSIDMKSDGLMVPQMAPPAPPAGGGPPPK